MCLKPKFKLLFLFRMSQNRSATLIVFIFSFLFMGCDQSSQSVVSTNNENRWLIPFEDLTVGAEKEVIKSIDVPSFTQASLLTELPEDDLVLALFFKGELRAYPHSVLYEHELINDVINGTPITISYSPFTGTALAWVREIEGEVVEFGSSGLLYNANLMPYDRSSGSIWSQIKRQCINGTHFGKQLSVIPLIEISWSSWKELYPESMVHNYQTGYNFLYGPYPFLDYRTDNNFFIFPVPFEDFRLEAKDKVLVVEEFLQTLVFPYKLLEGQNNTLIEKRINGEKIMIVGNAQSQYMTAFKPKTLDGITLELKLIEEGPNILRDEKTGTDFNIFGYATNGSLKGSQLKQLDQFTGFWFAISNFYPNGEIQNI